MAKGIGAVVPWEPSVTIITDDRKTGREVDTIFPYNLYEGMFYVRQELIDNVPDVVQAISDAFMEATLWIRLNPDQAADFLAAEPMLKAYGKPLLLQQVNLYNNLYKPTASYPFAKMWGDENARIAKWLKDRNRLTRELTAIRCQFHGENLPQARLDHPGAGAVYSERLVGQDRRSSLSGLRQRHHVEGAAAMAGKGRSNQRLVL